MTFKLASASLGTVSTPDDLRRALAASLANSGVVSSLIETAADYWATDDEVTILEAERSDAVVRATGHIAFTDTPWEACGATIHAQRRTIPITLEVDVDTGHADVQVS
ncbi:MAG: hypothetical protein AAGF99_00630 [Bacteroidota bacterium]